MVPPCICKRGWDEQFYRSPGKRHKSGFHCIVLVRHLPVNMVVDVVHVGVKLKLVELIQHDILLGFVFFGDVKALHGK